MYIGRHMCVCIFMHISIYMYTLHPYILYVCCIVPFDIIIIDLTQHPCSAPHLALGAALQECARGHLRHHGMTGPGAEQGSQAAARNEVPVATLQGQTTVPQSSGTS